MHRTSNTTPLKKLYFIEDEDVVGTTDLVHSSIRQMEEDSVDEIIQVQMPDTSTTVMPGISAAISSPICPDVRIMPDYMNIPKLWNVDIECDNDLVAEGVEVDERELSSLNSDTSFEIVDL